jgi:hypothetical protein
MIDDMHTGLNSFHYLHEYSYLDTTYEIYYGHDLILKTPEAKKQKKKDQKREVKDKDAEIKLSDELKKNRSDYEKGVKKVVKEK